MSAIIAIDPGTIQSAIIIVRGTLDPQTGYADISANECVIPLIETFVHAGDDVVIEQVKCYGMPAGDSILETVFWSGRFAEAAYRQGAKITRIPRATVKAHICKSAAAKDGNVIQALKDRFGDKGTKNNPDWFYGFKADMWQAYALLVAFAESAEQKTA